MKIKKYFSIIILLFFTDFFAQQYNLTNTFNVENSTIAGNFIFDIVEDHNHFI